jgi:hypothetical protein
MKSIQTFKTTSGNHQKFKLQNKLEAVAQGPDVLLLLKELLAESDALACIDYNEIDDRFETVPTYLPVVPVLPNIMAATPAQISLQTFMLTSFDKNRDVIKRALQSNAKLVDIHRKALLAYHLLLTEDSPLITDLNSYIVNCDLGVTAAAAACDAIQGGLIGMQDILKAGDELDAISEPLYDVWFESKYEASPIMVFRHAYTLLVSYCKGDVSTYGASLTAFHSLSDEHMSFGKFEVEWDRSKNALAFTGNPLDPLIVEHALVKAVKNPHLEFQVNKLLIDLALPVRAYREADFRRECRILIQNTPSKDSPCSVSKSVNAAFNVNLRGKRPNKPMKPKAISVSNSIKPKAISAPNSSTSTSITLSRDDPTLPAPPNSFLARMRSKFAGKVPQGICTRCNRPGHFYFECKATTCDKCKVRFADRTVRHDIRGPSCK